MSRCSWNAGGQQCKWPGSFSSSLNGAGPWRCYWHRELGAGFEDQRAGELITYKSLEWDGTPDAYWAARNAKVAPERDESVTPETEEGQWSSAA